MFEEQIAFFIKEYNVLTWDAPAHGKSRPFGSFSFHDVARYIKDILDECAVNEVVLVGQSLGGYFAQAFIKRYPEYAKGFVSIDVHLWRGLLSKFDIWF